MEHDALLQRQDLVAAAQHVEQEFEPVRLLVGSLGGAAVLRAAGELPAVKAVAAIGAPFDTAHVCTLLTADVAAIERDGEASVSIAGRTLQIRREFLEDLRDGAVESMRSSRWTTRMASAPAG